LPVQIILMRHGRPMLESHLKLSAQEYGLWVERYNMSGIDRRYSPPPAAMEQARRCSYFVCSNLPRSLESLEALGINGADICDALFREMEMPSAAWRRPRLPAWGWSALFRFIWIMGYTENAESFTSARKRARRCGQKLVEVSVLHVDILFVGHGLLNRLIGKFLRDEGWTWSERSTGRYWESDTYCLYAQSREVARC
jgi:broad specificity phosphatase PhoE